MFNEPVDVVVILMMSSNLNEKSKSSTDINIAENFDLDGDGVT